MRRTRKKDRYGTYDTLFDKVTPHVGQTFTVPYIVGTKNHVLNTRIRHDAEENGCRVTVRSEPNHFMVTVVSYDYGRDFGRILYAMNRNQE